LGKSLTLFFVNRQIADKRTTRTSILFKNRSPSIVFFQQKTVNSTKHPSKQILETSGLMNAKI